MKTKASDVKIGDSFEYKGAILRRITVEDKPTMLYRCYHNIVATNDQDDNIRLVPVDTVVEYSYNTLYRYRWNYSEGPGSWFFIEINSDLSEPEIYETFKYLEISDGFRYATSWVGFEYGKV